VQNYSNRQIMSTMQSYGLEIILMVLLK